MGMNLEVYVLREGITKDNMFVHGMTSHIEAVDHIIFDKETYFNNQVEGSRGTILTSNLKYKGDIISKRGCCGSGYVWMTVERLQNYELKPKFKENKRLLNELYDLDDKRVIVLGWT